MPSPAWIRFREQALDNMVAVGRLTPTSARIWVRSKFQGEHRFSVWKKGRPALKGTIRFRIEPGNSNDGTAVIDYPASSNAPVELEPGTQYLFEVQRGSQPVGKGRFETPPKSAEDAPSRFSIALMSCHQPFDESGAVRDAAKTFLKQIPGVLSDHDTKFLLLGGDQVYSDAPHLVSLTNPLALGGRDDQAARDILACSVEEVRELFHEHYRAFWGNQDLRNRIYARYACYPTLDDHELADDWGVKLEHAGAGFKDFKAGALLAYHDYQASRIMDYPAAGRAFDYEFEFGPLGVIVLDTRSRRVTRKNLETDILGSFQQGRFKQYLKQHADKAVLMVMISVPIIHINDLMAYAGSKVDPADELDIKDHWSYSLNRDDRNRLLNDLHQHQEAHPEQRIVLVSGDVHIGTCFQMNWRKRKSSPAQTWYQFTSSALTHNDLSGTAKWLSGAVPSAVKSLDCRFSRNLNIQNYTTDVQLLDRQNNPCLSLNVGIIEVDTSTSPATLRFKLFGPGDAGKASLMFDSQPMHH